MTCARQYQNWYHRTEINKVRCQQKQTSFHTEQRKWESVEHVSLGMSPRSQSPRRYVGKLLADDFTECGCAGGRQTVRLTECQVVRVQYASRYTHSLADSVILLQPASTSTSKNRGRRCEEWNVNSYHLLVRASCFFFSFVDFLVLSTFTASKHIQSQNWEGERSGSTEWEVSWEDRSEYSSPVFCSILEAVADSCDSVWRVGESFVCV